ncbi:universal stress protein PHOS32 [Capsella rubella]|nr:universal stress protein PHOS32 [Capsella rubella]
MGKPAGYWVNKIRTSFKGGSSSSKSLDEGSTSGSRKNGSKHSKNLKAEEANKNGGEGGVQVESGRKVMVVVDTTSQSKNALQWALTHCVQDEDNITLLHVTKTPVGQAIDETQRERNSRAHELVHPLKNFCQLKKPNVKTEVVVVETAEEKGKTIVEESKKQGAGVLVLGQRKRTSKWRVIWKWRAKGGMGGGVVEYCIHNSDCMAIAVRKKSNNGGYLITTKRHKDFWLLA